MWVLVTVDNHGLIHNLVGPFDSEDAAFGHLDRWEEFYADLERDIIKEYSDYGAYADTEVLFMNHPEKMWS